jgi:hypothetical protein
MTNAHFSNYLDEKDIIKKFHILESRHITPAFLGQIGKQILVSRYHGLDLRRLVQLIQQLVVKRTRGAQTQQ